MNNTRTLSVGIDYAQLTKEIMATLAISTACRADEQTPALPFNRCRLNELAAIKAQAACTSLCSALGGYIAKMAGDSQSATIDFMLPSALPETASRLIAQRIDQYIALSVVHEFLASSPHLAAEMHKCHADRQRALSSLRQLLAPR